MPRGAHFPGRPLAQRASREGRGLYCKTEGASKPAAIDGTGADGRCRYARSFFQQARSTYAYVAVSYRFTAFIIYTGYKQVRIHTHEYTSINSILICVRVFFTLNRSFYPSTSDTYAFYYFEIAVRSPVVLYCRVA